MAAWVFLEIKMIRLLPSWCFSLWLCHFCCHSCSNALCIWKKGVKFWVQDKKDQPDWQQKPLLWYGWCIDAHGMGDFHMCEGIINMEAWGFLEGVRPRKAVGKLRRNFGWFIVKSSREWNQAKRTEWRNRQVSRMHEMVGMECARNGSKLETTNTQAEIDL